MTKKTNKKNKASLSESNLIDITRKKFRWSDYIAEKVIKGVAFLSITIIVLIFVFVFRESLPIFASQNHSEHTESSANAGEMQETYGEVTDQPLLEEVQETYGEVTDLPVPEEVQETYGEVVDTSLQSTSVEEDYSVSAGSGYSENQTALKSLVTKDWIPVSQKPRYGILPLIVGTFKITIIALLFAAPLAILAALYTASFASKRMKEIIKPTIEMLAGFPSVVIGFFALMVLATFLQDVFNYDTRLNAFVGGIAMGIAAIPIIFTITEDALTSVPKAYYEASLALGASKWQTAFFVILPAATPGIFAAILLGIGRVFGETMIALMATGNAAQMD
ncbi:MAG TPA: phosphate ABC transporter permease subunit PstC, partial [Prolixibacteraceae bacterium]|nr:phosphate ABC transporter permease subunit PstC [Prolixibacteraceae bacterium]